MNTQQQMNFSVDKANRKINVTREFAAPLSQVWPAWTDSKILDQWWAPKPWKAKTKSMDFREGGYWLYAMVGPQGEEHWARADYKKIEPQKSFTVKDSFAKEDGTIDNSLPGSTWTNRFSESGQKTTVFIEIEYPTAEDLEKTIEMGFKEGFTMGLENLDELLARKS